MVLDINKDGALGLDGVKAGLLFKEFRFNTDECREVFELLNKGNLFYYKEHFLMQNPNLKLLM